jgi:hypothetical protein
LLPRNGRCPPRRVVPVLLLHGVHVEPSAGPAVTAHILLHVDVATRRRELASALTNDEGSACSGDGPSSLLNVVADAYWSSNAKYSVELPKPIASPAKTARECRDCATRCATLFSQTVSGPVVFGVFLIVLVHTKLGVNFNDFGLYLLVAGGGSRHWRHVS